MKTLNYQVAHPDLKMRLPVNFKHLVIFLVLMVLGLQAFSQSTLFTYTTEPVILSTTQTKLLAYYGSVDRIRSIEFLSVNGDAIDDANLEIQFTIDGVNNDQNISFTVEDVVYDSPTNYVAYARSNWGTVDLYYTAEGVGGTIDLYDRLFDIVPFTNNLGILIERNLESEDTTICATATFALETDYCEGDCGAAVLDVLLLVTPEAREFLDDNFGLMADWWLFLNTYSINTIFRNSLITNKVVRTAFVEFTPTFEWETLGSGFFKANTDLNALAIDDEANELQDQVGADVMVMLTNNDYGTTFGLAFFNDPTSTFKYALTQVEFIDGSRYTYAHEVAHFFGCDHSSEADNETCPFGKNLSNGRNTVLADNAPINTRIPYYSSPNVLFDGIPTGDEDTRDNAQQIRAAFCELANNAEGHFSVSFTPTFQILCTGLSSTVIFTSSVEPGFCTPFPSFITSHCGIAPYTYEWRKSLMADFASSTVICTTANCTTLAPAILGCPYFYLRLTVTSDNEEVTSFTRLYFTSLCSGCGEEAPLNLTGFEQVANLMYAAPNPSGGDIVIFASDGQNIPENIMCFDSQGKQTEIMIVPGTEGVKIKTSELPTGLYYFQAKLGSSVETIKVFINTY